MLVLAVGDLHIPDRAVDIPHKFKKLLSPSGKIQQVLCLGNSTGSQSTLKFFKSISPDFQMVKGEFDRDLKLPLSLVFTYDKLKVGIMNGFSVIPKGDPLSLLTQARMMDVDILITGATHRVEAYTIDGKFFVNPGSTTGAFSTGAMDKEEIEIIESILKEKKDLFKEAQEAAEKRKSEIDSTTTTTDAAAAAGEPVAEDKENKSTDAKPEPDLKKNSGSDAEEEESGHIEDATNKEEPVDEDEDYPDDIEEYLDSIPSFVLLDIQGSVCTLFLYTLIEGEVKVDKITYRKDESK